MAIKRSSKVDSSFSSSSMTDLIFLLLVFFIMATTLINPNNAVKLTLPSSSSTEGDPSIITLSIVGDSDSPSGFKYVVNRNEAYTDVMEVESALRDKYAEYQDKPVEERPYISLRCDEKVTVDVLVQIIDITREQKYKMVLATKNR
ncbi:MAG: biopolymer transporter ExbD [Alistipes sp.]|jgi:biopolymer transport protein ExbD|nr:biopolymer transporter ExbD [Alistipes sp.]MBO7311989.1 biopolymer transporter ExbD [Alistipes sp.]